MPYHASTTLALRSARQGYSTNDAYNVFKYSLINA